MSPQLSETEDLSDTESANGAQAMSVSTPEDSDDKNLNAEDDIQSDFDSSTTGANAETEDLDEADQLVDDRRSRQDGSGGQGGSARTAEGNGKTGVVPPGGRWIEPEPDSTVSDYSEMADPLKEHLANVQIIQKEDLDVGNTMFPNQFSVGQKIIRSPDETEEEFTKRLRKINYLSLAQEFAALKKIDADALPFDLHKGGAAHDLGRGVRNDYSPMSETSSETDLTDSSPAVTPMDAGTQFAPQSAPQPLLAPPSGQPVSESADSGVSMSKLAQRFERAINPKDALTATTTMGPTIPTSDDENDEAEKDQPDGESHELVPPSVTRGNDRKSPGGASDKLEDFDVYNIESTLPQLDWSMLEEQLQRAAEEERQKQRVSTAILLCILQSFTR